MCNGTYLLQMKNTRSAWMVGDDNAALKYLIL